jgi:hypothetical protein
VSQSPWGLCRETVYEPYNDAVIHTKDTVKHLKDILPYNLASWLTLILNTENIQYVPHIIQQV